MSKQKPTPKKEEIEPIQIMGIFWIILGIIILLTAYFPPTLQGKITDLIAGTLLLGIGLASYFKGKSNKRKRLSSKKK